MDCSDRSLATDDGTGLSSVSCKSVADAISAEQEKELPADQPYLWACKDLSCQRKKCVGAGGEHVRAQDDTYGTGVMV